MGSFRACCLFYYLRLKIIQVAIETLLMVLRTIITSIHFHPHRAVFLRIPLVLEAEVLYCKRGKVYRI